MNGFIGIKTNWYTKVKKHLHVSKQLDYITYTQRDRSQDETFKGDVPLHPRYNAVMGTAARAML